MEALPPPLAGIVNPRWLLLNRYGFRRSDDASIAGDARTVADACTSTGWPFRVSIGVAPLPATSCLNYRWLGDEPPGGDRNDRPTVIAAHGDCVLFELRTPNPCQEMSIFPNRDYFLYEAGTATPPSLSMLPACYIPMQFERHRGGDTRRITRLLQKQDTVVLRRGDGDLLVVQLEVSTGDDVPGASKHVDEHKASDDVPRVNAELCVVGRGGGDWELMEAMPITFYGGDGAELMQGWETGAAIPVGDRFLCFVDYARGMLLCDTAGMEGRRPLTLRYMPLPVEAPNHAVREPRNLSAVAGASAVRLVSVDTRCCCGGSGRTSCAPGRFAFTVTMWTMSLTTVDDDEEPSLATWVKDGEVDCEEVWGFQGYEGIPRVYLEHPIVSSDNSDVVCFTVCEDRYTSEMKVWMVEVNLRSKELLSVIPCTTVTWRAECHVAAKLRW